jgi:hypothetical protein
MIKKLLLIILLIAPLTMEAQNDTGSWKIHSSFGSTISNLVDEGDYVYYLVSSNLYRFNKKTRENEVLNKFNDLSDIGIKQIYFNNAKKYLVVVYDNSNIDIIMKSGKVVNLPDIKDIIINRSKTINDITFAGDKFYVATNFGYVVVDDNKFVINESHYYDDQINSVAVVGKWLLIDADNKIYYSLLSAKHETLSTFKSIIFESAKLFPIDANTLFITTGWMFKAKIYEQIDGSLSFSTNTCVQGYPTTLQKTATGYIASFHYWNSSAYVDQYMTFDASGNNPQTVTLSENELYSSTETDGSVWAVSARGLHRIANGQSGVYYKPSGFTVSVPFWMTYNDKTNQLYVANSGPNMIFNTQNVPTSINTLSGNIWTDVTPTGATYNGTYYPVFDIDDPNTYYLGSWWYGVYKVTGGKISMLYNWQNSPLIHALNYYCHTIIAMDKSGNLWVIQTDNQATPVMILSHDKLKLTNVTASDWYTPSIPNVGGNKRASFVATKVSNYKVFTNGGYQEPIVFWNDGGDISASTMASRSYATFLDKEDKPVAWDNIFNIVEDNTGLIWIGTNNGVISLNPTESFNENFRVNHIKVPSDDGTSLSSYLLDGQQVNCIAVDGANRKWIGTNASGVYLVSADGSQILKQFSTSNSYLTSNQIYRICCKPNSNTVYIITSNGFLEYTNDESSGAANYDKVKISPNPVRPDFTGYITINGLMSNSYLKITNEQGNLVKSLTSSAAGVVGWDGCDESGARVKTGAYYVHASQNDNEVNSPVVAKIMIIR